jgi:hypothetical protein
VFLVPGQPPMQGRSVFEKALRGLLASHRLESDGDFRKCTYRATLGTAGAH